MVASPKVDTAHAQDRRILHFQTVDEVLSDVDRLAAAERGGKLRLMGNWPFGQNLGHLATWVDYGYDGTPMKVPLPLKLMLRLMKRRFLYKPMPAGRHIPRVPGGTLGMDPLSSEEGLARFQRSFTRLKKECPPLPHVLFGPLTHEEWTSVHLRHAELHLSFLRAD